MEDLKMYKLKQTLGYVISNSELTPSAVYYVLKDTLHEIEAVMINSVNQQLEAENNKQEERQESEE